MLITMDGKYQTRDGRPVRILCVDCKQTGYPVVAMIGVYGHMIERYREDGTSGVLQDENNELVPIPEPPKYVPYTDADRDLVRGKWIRQKDDKEKEFTLHYFTRGCVVGWSWAELLVRCEFMDGTPCGKLA